MMWLNNCLIRAVCCHLKGWDPAQDPNPEVRQAAIASERGWGHGLCAMSALCFQHKGRPPHNHTTRHLHHRAIPSRRSLSPACRTT